MSQEKINRMFLSVRFIRNSAKENVSKDACKISITIKELDHALSAMIFGRKKMVNFVLIYAPQINHMIGIQRDALIFTSFLMKASKNYPSSSELPTISRVV